MGTLDAGAIATLVAEIDAPVNIVAGDGRAPPPPRRGGGGGGRGGRGAARAGPPPRAGAARPAPATRGPAPATPPLPERERIGVARVSFGPRPMRATLALLRRMAREWLDTGTYVAMTADTLSYAEVNGMFAGYADYRKPSRES